MKKVLITSGGSKIHIDRVRHIGNMSKGTFGSKIASEFLSKRFKVDFLKSTDSRSPFKISLDFAKGDEPHIFGYYNAYLKYRDFYNQYEYSSFNDYASSLEKLIKDNNPDVIVLAAAISDYGVSNYVDGKIRSTTKDNTIQLYSLPKLINNVRKWSNDKTYIVGFKLLVDSTQQDLDAACYDSIEKNQLDLIVGNDLRDIKNNDHILTVIDNKFNKFVYKNANDLVNHIVGDINV